MIGNVITELIMMIIVFAVGVQFGRRHPSDAWYVLRTMIRDLINRIVRMVTPTRPLPATTADAPK